MNENVALRRPMVAVHQPNFFPWLGFFHKIRWSDQFVLLDDVQLQRRAGTVTNRVAFYANKKQLYVTAPIARASSSTPPINEVQFATGEDFRGRFASFLTQTYSKAPFMQELGEEILALVRNPTSSLSAYNETAIRRLAELLELSTPIVCSSTLDVSTTSTQRLVDIVQRCGGLTYLAGAGARDYHDDRLFFDRGLDICDQQFNARLYPRGKEERVAGLSIVDALFHLGLAGTRELLDTPLDPAGLRRAVDELARPAPPE